MLFWFYHTRLIYSINVLQIYELEMNHQRGVKDAKETMYFSGHYSVMSNNISGRNKHIIESNCPLPKIIVFSQYLVFLDQIVIDLRTAGRQLFM